MIRESCAWCGNEIHLVTCEHCQIMKMFKGHVIAADGSVPAFELRQVIVADEDGEIIGFPAPNPDLPLGRLANMIGEEFSVRVNIGNGIPGSLEWRYRATLLEYVPALVFRMKRE